MNSDANNKLITSVFVWFGVVGGADFTAMEELDGDAVRISFNGRYAVRGKTDSLLGDYNWSFYENY